MLLAVVGYALPVLAGIRLHDGSFPIERGRGLASHADGIGGPCLGGLVAIAGLVSMWGLFNAQLLYASRIPFVMARDGWLPAPLAQQGSETAVPRKAIIALCTVTACLALLSFNNLVVMIGIVYTVAMVLEFLALIIFRIRWPDAHRPFRVPGGTLGLVIICLAPLIVAVTALVATVRDGDSYGPQLLLIGASVLSGIALYLTRRRCVDAMRPNS